MSFEGGIEEIKQKQAWRKYIEWEKSNPLKSEDTTFVAKRGKLSLGNFFNENLKIEK